MNYDLLFFFSIDKVIQIIEKDIELLFIELLGPPLRKVLILPDPITPY